MELMVLFYKLIVYGSVAAVVILAALVAAVIWATMRRKNKSQ